MLKSTRGTLHTVGMHNGGFSHRRVADHFRVNHFIIVRLMQRFPQTGNVTDRPRAGRPRKTTPREDRLILTYTNQIASCMTTRPHTHRASQPAPMITHFIYLTICLIRTAVYTQRCCFKCAWFQHELNIYLKILFKITPLFRKERRKTDYIMQHSLCKV
jgi:hypothetical protein